MSGGYRPERDVNSAYAGGEESPFRESRKALIEGLAAYQLVGGVMAYQGDDG